MANIQPRNPSQLDAASETRDVASEQTPEGLAGGTAAASSGRGRGRDWAERRKQATREASVHASPRLPKQGV